MDNIPQGKAVLLLSWVITLNLFSIWYIFHLLYAIPFINETDLTKISPVIIFLFLVFINYKIFVWNDKYTQIQKHYDNERGIKKYIGSLLVSLYTILSFAMVFLLIYISRKYS